MSYQVRIEATAEHDLEKLPKDVLRRIDTALAALRDSPRPRGVVKLQGHLGEGWRIRVGEYRVLFTIDDGMKVVSVFRVRSRQSAYRP